MNFNRIQNYTIILCTLCIIATSCNEANPSISNVSKQSHVENTGDNQPENIDPSKRILKSKKIYLSKTDSTKSRKELFVFSETFDSTGKKTSEVEQLDSSNRRAFIAWRYTYHDNNDTIFKRCHRESLDGHSINKECFFKYDTNKKEVEIQIYHFSGWLSLFENKFNPDGSIAEKCEYRHYKLVRKNTYEYDSNGKVIKECCYKQGKLDYKYIYQYDSNGNISEIRNYNISGKMIGKTIYQYDANGNCIKYCKYRGDGSLEGIYIVKYEYY